MQKQLQVFFYIIFTGVPEYVKFVSCATVIVVLPEFQYWALFFKRRRQTDDPYRRKMLSCFSCTVGELSVKPRMVHHSESLECLCSFSNLLQISWNTNSCISVDSIGSKPGAHTCEPGMGTGGWGSRRETGREGTHPPGFIVWAHSPPHNPQTVDVDVLAPEHPRALQWWVLTAGPTLQAPSDILRQAQMK